jgi:SulP family sulfate permease
MNAMSLALLGSIDSLLTSVVVDKLRSARHDSDQELVGQGVGNLVSGLFGGLPGAGATMRSVVNVKAGGSTNWSGVFHGLILVAVLIGLGPYAARIPQACLAGILITVGISIIDYRGLKSIKKAPREDVIVMIVVILLTVFVDLIMAVVIGITLASTLFAKKLADMKSTRVEDLASLEHLLTAVDRLPHELRQKIYIYTFDGPLFFGEMRNFTHSIEQHPEARYVILRFTNVPMIDQTAIYALEDAIARWRGAGMNVLFAELQPPIFKALEDFGVVHENCYFGHLDEAIESIAASQAS